jgi:putative ABC transport system ATP-binding protein
VLVGINQARRSQRARELLELVGLGDMGKKKPDQLSGGEQQRVAIAVALANEPTLLLADEPTGELDSVTASEVMALLHKLNRELNLTIIIVTHDVAIAAAADRTIAIRDGRTSTETVRREAPLTDAGSHTRTSSAIIGLPGETHLESVLIDRVGRLQLPKEAIENIPFNGRALVRIHEGHVELWPLGAEMQNNAKASSAPASGQASHEDHSQQKRQ